MWIHTSQNKPPLTFQWCNLMPPPEKTNKQKRKHQKKYFQWAVETDYANGTPNSPGMTKQVTTCSLSSCLLVQTWNKCSYTYHLPFSPIVLRPFHSLVLSPYTMLIQVGTAGLVVLESDDSPCRFGLLQLSWMTTLSKNFSKKKEKSLERFPLSVCPRIDYITVKLCHDHHLEWQVSCTYQIQFALQVKTIFAYLALSQCKKNWTQYSQRRSSFS